MFIFNFLQFVEQFLMKFRITLSHDLVATIKQRSSLRTCVKYKFLPKWLDAVESNKN